MVIGAIIQARTSSSRLPNKVLKELPYDSGITVLEQVIRRVKKSSRIDKIIVATTIEESDKNIINIANKENVLHYRGSKNDVLSRYYNAAQENKIDIIVRITSDCPCISWNIIDEIIKKHLEESNDYTSNSLERSYPHGLDVEVISFKALEIAFRESTDSFEREHVCPYLYRNQDNFKIGLLKAFDKLKYPEYRITLDTKEDYLLLCYIFESLYDKNNFFDEYEIVNLLNSNSWVNMINENVIQKRFFQTKTDELKEAIKILKLQELYYSASILENNLTN